MMKLETREIFETVSEVARQELEWTGDIELSMRLVEDLQLDSIRLLTLAMAVEDRFRICLDEDDEASILTLGDLVSIIESKLAVAPPITPSIATADA